LLSGNKRWTTPASRTSGSKHPARKAADVIHEIKAGKEITSKLKLIGYQLRCYGVFPFQRSIGRQYSKNAPTSLPGKITSKTLSQSTQFSALWRNKSIDISRQPSETSVP
jgi:hypothetical protein